MAEISDADRARFAFAVARVWASQGAGGGAKRKPEDVLKDFDLKLPQGMKTPVIPPRPDGDLGKAWMGLTFDHWDLKIEKLPPDVNSISVSSLACMACPVSCFSSVSN